MKALVSFFPGRVSLLLPECSPMDFFLLERVRDEHFILLFLQS